MLWRTALSAVGQFPVLGSGPDGFARVFGQARPEAFLDIRPPEYHASAAHDVPLQIGATLGLPGLLLWFALIAVVVVVVVRWLRQRTQVDALGAALVGAATAYLAQSLVSIDMLALVAVGWALLGSCLGRGQGEVPKTRIPALAWLCSLVLGILGAGVILPSAWASVRAMDARTSDEIVTSLASPWTPCDRLDVLAQRLLRSEEPAQAIPALREAAARDPRCIGIQQVLAQAALDAGNMPLAQDTAQGIVSVDPLNTPAWLALAVAQASQGDLAAAQESLDNAERLAAHDPKRYADSIASVKDLIAAGGTPTTSLG